jgi:hypothetical protein
MEQVYMEQAMERIGYVGQCEASDELRYIEGPAVERDKALAAIECLSDRCKHRALARELGQKELPDAKREIVERTDANQKCKIGWLARKSCSLYVEEGSVTQMLRAKTFAETLYESCSAVDGAPENKATMAVTERKELVSKEDGSKSGLALYHPWRQRQ